MNKSVGIFLAAIVILLAILAIFFFMDREQEVEMEEAGDEVVQQEEQEVFLDEMDEVLGQEDLVLPSDEFIQCLVDSGMVVYASKTCPACSALADSFGGYDAVEELFVLCGDDWETCEAEMQTNYVPEVQYNGEVFEAGRSMEDFAVLTGCEL